jgi:translation initiation factor 3 subunit A
LKEEEARRLAEEQRLRAEQRIKAEQQRIQREEIEKQIKELKATTKVDIDLPEDLNDLDSQRIRILKLQALEKEKSLLGEQLRIAGKRIDHLERAYRKEEIKHLKSDYEKQMEADRAAYEKAKVEELREAEEKHKEDVALKHRLSRLVSPYQQFVTTVKQQRKAEFEKRQKVAQKELESKKAARVKEVKERLAKERREHEEAERRQREEEEREAAEAEAKAKADEEKRQRLLEEKAKRDEERKSVYPNIHMMHKLTVTGQWTRRHACNVKRRRRPRPRSLPRRRVLVEAVVSLTEPSRASQSLLRLEAHHVLRLLVASQHGVNARL